MKKFLEPAIEVVEFSVEDVITTSGTTPPCDDNQLDDNWD